MMCYLATKKTKGLLSLVVTGRDLEDIMLSAVSETEKDKDCMTSYSKMCKILRREILKRKKLNSEKEMRRWAKGG